jgi:hypothetical protein
MIIWKISEKYILIQTYKYLKYYKQYENFVYNIDSFASHSYRLVC